jgi:hypothetical protein
LGGEGIRGVIRLIGAGEGEGGRHAVVVSMSHTAVEMTVALTIKTA